MSSIRGKLILRPALNPVQEELVSIYNLCKKVFTFCKWQHHWPTVANLHEKYNKPGKGYFTLTAIKYYADKALDQGYLTKVTGNGLALTNKYYEERHLTPLEPEWSSAGGARARQKTEKAKLWQKYRKYKKLGLIPESEEIYDGYRESQRNGDYETQAGRFSEDSETDGIDPGADWRSSPIRSWDA